MMMMMMMDGIILVVCGGSGSSGWQKHKQVIDHVPSPGILRNLGIRRSDYALHANKKKKTKEDAILYLYTNQARMVELNDRKSSGQRCNAAVGLCLIEKERKKVVLSFMYVLTSSQVSQALLPMLLLSSILHNCNSSSSSSSSSSSLFSHSRYLYLYLLYCQSYSWSQNE